MADMFEVLDILVAGDHNASGDFWRDQAWVALPSASKVRPKSYRSLESKSLRGNRFGVPAMYVNAETEVGKGENCGIGGPTGQRIDTRASVIDLWTAARRALEDGLKGLKETHRIDLEEWMDKLGLDAVIFPAVA